MKVWSRPSIECRLCHRIGTRQFSPVGGEGWECTNDRACAVRVKVREVTNGGCPVAEQRVTEADIRAVLAGTYTPEGIDRWLRAFNDNLGGLPPAAVLKIGGKAGRDVLAEAERVAGAM